MTSVTSSFPYPTITPVAALPQAPTYQTLKRLQLELNANAISVHSNRGNGLLGHLILTDPDATLDAPFVVPLNPGILDIPPNQTQEQIRVLRDTHTLAKDDFNTYHATDKALKAQLLSACPATYLKDLEDPATGFALVTTRQLLTHLWTHYGRITPSDLNRNVKALLSLTWNTIDPITQLYDQVQACTTFARAGGAPIAETTVVEAIYDAVERTGTFTKSCDDWRKRPEDQKTFAEAKAFFLKEAQDANRSTAGQFNFGPTIHQANAAAATKEQPAPVEHLNKDKGKDERQKSARQPQYCWTHGICTHSSANCRQPLSGHQPTATYMKRLGGSKQSQFPGSD